MRRLTRAVTTLQVQCVENVVFVLVSAMLKVQDWAGDVHGLSIPRESTVQVAILSNADGRILIGRDEFSW